jgi:hypothetical protein
MSSRPLRKIARQNGAQAAGTKTPEGIQKSSMNAQRHGLTGKALVLTNESQAQYDALEADYVARFQPADGVEMDLIDDMVTSRWRLRRIWIMQTAAFDLKMDQMEAEIAEKFTTIDQPTRTVVAFSNMANNEKSLQLLLRYETTYNRMYNRALKLLQELQNSRVQPTESATSEKLRNDPKPAQDEGSATPIRPESVTQIPIPSAENDNQRPNSPPPPEIDPATPRYLTE